ncbi:hypothetical protein DDB_G0270330 [Dictyostelium discoideum AX4]|uniref:Pesticidal crystal protein N-terminal domain-containing protein n=1 Tax=Dictyostelium discoideum TaxID=44689 RepID=Q55BW9_DICDI|nr:hypothetical protein DDB_G0270330 [Dictyostelium discoideum AX4]EAL72515.1 hypothetical protein DDB_G0270330 [Dictyostelium discoideum AX4]|eukprot:XP_646712.1 hypothetical protein DDB_G0270330 [Dictyostelium discoideum AX4]
MKKVIFLSLIVFLCLLLLPSNDAHIVNDPTLPDYIGLVRGGICSIPVYGAAIDSCLYFVFNLFYPKQPEEPKVTMKEFNERLEFIAKDMKTYTNKVINASVLQTCRYQFKTLKKSSDNYMDMLNIWKKEFGATGLTTEETKNNLPPVFYVFLSKLEDCLIQFSDPTRISLLAKLYIDTAVIYSALLRDANYNGISMGLHPGIVNGTNKDIIFSAKIRLHSLDVFSNYMIILPQILIQNDNRCRTNSNGNWRCEDKFPVPDWSGTISLFLYSDVTRYDREVVYKPTSTSSTGERISWERGDNTQKGDSGTIIIRDFADVGRNIKKGVVWTLPYERPQQSFDFLTGCYGIYVQSYPYRKYVSDDAVDITFVETENQPNYDIAFIQSFLLSKPNNQVKIRIYYSYHLNKTYEYIPNNFQLKVIKTNSNGYELNKIRRILASGSDDLYYLNKTYSFHTQGSSKNLVTRLTFHQNRSYQLYDRFVFETPKFDVGKDFSVILLPISRFSIHLFSIEVISDK